MIRSKQKYLDNPRSKYLADMWGNHVFEDSQSNVNMPTFDIITPNYRTLSNYYRDVMLPRTFPTDNVGRDDGLLNSYLPGTW